MAKPKTTARQREEPRGKRKAAVDAERKLAEPVSVNRNLKLPPVTPPEQLIRDTESEEEEEEAQGDDEEE